MSAFSPVAHSKAHLTGSRANAPSLTWAEALLLLMSRTVLFILMQGMIAAIMAVGGSANAWRESAYWWPVSAALGSCASLLILHLMLHREGLSLWSLYKPDREHVLQHILITLATTGVGAVLVSLPNGWFAGLLFGDATAGNEMMFRPLPLAAAVVCLIVFPVSVGLSEQPTYFGYLLPRLRVLSGKMWIAVLVAGFWLAAQHMALPLIFDARFILWRLLMFLPFALFTALMLAWKPRLLPYFVVIHILLDMTTAVFLFP